MGAESKGKTSTANVPGFGGEVAYKSRALPGGHG